MITRQKSRVVHMCLFCINMFNYQALYHFEILDSTNSKSLTEIFKFDSYHHLETELRCHVRKKRKERMNFNIATW